MGTVPFESSRASFSPWDAAKQAVRACRVYVCNTEAWRDTTYVRPHAFTYKTS